MNPWRGHGKQRQGWRKWAEEPGGEGAVREGMCYRGDGWPWSLGRAGCRVQRRQRRGTRAGLDGLERLA